MKVALVGFYNSGKTTLFNAMTKQRIETSIYQTSSDVVHRGILHVEDSRLIKISELVNPKKTTFTTIECVDPAGLIKNNTVHNSKVIKEIMDADALLYVLRGFEDLSIPYQFDSIEPLRDFKEIDYELLMIDLDLVIKRIERIIEQKKKGQKINNKEVEVLNIFKESLEEGRPLRNINLNSDLLREIKHLSFISLKPSFAVINTDEKSFNKGKYRDTGFIEICAILESEINQVPEEEINKFLSEMGIDEPASKKIIRKAYESLNYISFFTAGHKEARAWSIQKDTKAVEAAGKIHSDIQRGFIKAEIISYNDFISVGGDLAVAKHKGILRLEGKEYIVKDGDIITFRFKI